MNDHVFFVGIGGSGMSVLARYLRMSGTVVSGSDRENDRGLRSDFYASLSQLGITLFAQNGSGIHPSLSRVVTSTAVESQIPDIIAATSLGLPIVHRSEELARITESRKSIAIAGTSGKSTVTGMLAWILTRCGFDAGVLAGAAIPGLGSESTDSDCRLGNGDWIVFEADESDGTLVRYHPSFGLIHNITKDHKPIEELREIFTTFANQSQHKLFINADCSEADSIASTRERYTYGFSSGSAIRASDYREFDWETSFHVEGNQLRLKVPGYHNAVNALAAYTIAQHLGIPPSEIRESLATFPGIRRRFERIGSTHGITVVDDFGHNPDKIRATINASKRLCERRIIIFQPHGFGPTRFLQQELQNAFIESLGPQDILILTPIFYAGGTVARDFNSEVLVNAIRPHLQNTHMMERTQIPEFCASVAKAGDLIIVMGARDPSLTSFARTILYSLDK